MTRIIITFGLIAGLIMAAVVWLVGWLLEHDTVAFGRTELIGYASMLIALSMIFFGIKSYRDNYGGGTITFWKGVQVGVLISLIAGVIYFAGAMSYNLAHPNFQAKFMQKATEQTVGRLKEQGAPQEEIDKASANIDLMQKLFQNPVLFFLICMIEILPVGIVVTLICAGLLRQREVLPAAA